MKEKALKIKFSIALILIIIVLILIALLFIFIPKHNSSPSPDVNQNSVDDSKIQSTGAFKNFEYGSDGYTINITSTEPGHPSGDAFFQASFNYTYEDKTSASFEVDYMNVQLYPDSSNNNGIISDIVRPEEVIINNKTFYYYTNSAKDEANLYYVLPDSLGQLNIRVKGLQKYTSDGNYSSNSPIINKSVLESDALAGILSFTVSK